MPVDIVLDTSVLIAALRSRRGASFELLRLVGDKLAAPPINGFVVGIRGRSSPRSAELLAPTGSG